MKRTVQDVMTRPAIIAGELTGFKEIVRLLETHRISALPVVDDDRRVIGVVSETDLLLKEEHPDLEGKPSLLEPKRRRLERTKATALLAKDLMTAPAVTVGLEETLAAAARLMHGKAVTRLRS